MAVLLMTRRCNVDDCHRDARTRGWCRIHYRRWLQHGDPVFSKDGQARRFLLGELASRTATETCWRGWPFGHQHGYPTVGGNNRKVSHEVLILTGRPQPFAGAMALHSCDEPGCWNPSHLRWGTHQENMADRGRRGRTRTPVPRAGEDHPSAKLSNAQVREIRSRYRAGKNQWTGAGNGRELAAEFGVSPDTVRKIARGQHRASPH